MENVTSLFVYGSLRKGFQSPAYHYISKYFELLDDAIVQGKMYDMGSFPAAVPASDNSFIHGELFKIKNPLEFSWAIEQLDAYEGLNPEDGVPQLYDRKVVDVVCRNGTAKAWIYWYTGTIDIQPLIPTGDVFDFFAHKTKL